MEKRKKIISAALAMVMCVSALGLPASAEGSEGDLCSVAAFVYKTTDDGFKYYVRANRPDRCVVVDYFGEEKDVVIPETIDDCRVTAVAPLYNEKTYTKEFTTPVRSLTINAEIKTFYGGFSGSDSIEKVVLPDTLETVYEDSFVNCDRLKEVVIPETVDHVGANSFRGTPWYSEKEKKEGLVILGKTLSSGSKAKGDVVVPDGVKYIASCAFWDNDEMTSLVIPKSVVQVESEAVFSCDSLKKVTVKNGVESLGWAAFEYNDSLEKLILPPSINAVGGEVIRTGSGKQALKVYCCRGSYVEEALSELSQYNKKLKVCILPGKTSEFKVKAAKRRAKAEWKPVSTASGYQLQAALDSKFKTGCRTVTVKGKASCSCNMTGLKSGSRYYLRLRTYRTVDGRRYYGNYCKAVKVKVK